MMLSRPAGRFSVQGTAKPRSIITRLVTIIVAAGAACTDQHPAPDRELDWQFTPTWSVGGTGDAHLSVSEVFPFQVAATSRGRVYVLGWRERRIYILDSTGQVRDSLGRQGSGPGEFQDPLALSFGSKGDLFVVDWGLRRVARWDPAGKVEDPIPVTWHLDDPKMAFGGGRIWYQTTASTGEGESEVQLVALDSGVPQVVARVARQPRRVVDLPTCHGREISVQPFFAPTLVWSVADGGVGYVEGAGYAVHVIRSGKAPITLSRDLPLIAATEAAALKEAEGYMFNGCRVPATEAVRSIGYLDRVPRITELVLAPGGETWVRRRTDDGVDKVTDVFDSTGAFLGTLPSSTPFPAAFLGSDRIVVLGKDSSGVAVISAYSINRLSKGQ